MKILSALFDAVLIPVAVVKDAINPWPMINDDADSFTRQQIEKVEEDLIR